MRAYLVAPALLAAAAACGDNKTGSNPDAATQIDAPVQVDAPIDAPPSGEGSRVWAFGDVYVNNEYVAAGFTDGTGTLPYGPDAMAPISLAKVLSVQNVTTFDARGAKIAYLTDATVTGRFDLTVADADGSNPITIIEGPAAPVDIGTVALSPDGTKIAFRMDSAALDGGYDLYVAPTTAGATPVQISPARAAGSTAGQDVQDTLTWSADSKYVSFAADLVADGFDLAYVVDTTAATPTPVELIARADVDSPGVRGGILFDSANNLYFRAVAAGGTIYVLYTATAAGVRTAFPVPARTDTSAPDAGTFAITPDGTKIVFSADAPVAGAYDLYRADLPTGANTTKLTSLAAAGHADFFGVMTISPDATQIAMVADFAVATRFEPYVVALDGSTQTPRRLVSIEATCPGCSNPDANAVQWTADSAAIYVRGDLASDNDTRVFRVDASMTDQAPTLAVTTATGGDVFNLLVRPIP